MEAWSENGLHNPVMQMHKESFKWMLYFRYFCADCKLNCHWIVNTFVGFDPHNFPSRHRPYSVRESRTPADQNLGKCLPLVYKRSTTLQTYREVCTNHLLDHWMAILMGFSINFPNPMSPNSPMHAGTACDRWVMKQINIHIAKEHLHTVLTCKAESIYQATVRYMIMSETLNFLN